MSLKVPKPEGAVFESAVIERYRRLYFVKSVFRFSSLAFFGFRHKACRPVVGLLVVGLAEHEGLADASARPGELDEPSVVDDAVD